MKEWFIKAKEMELYRLQKADNPLLRLFKTELGLGVHQIEKTEQKLVFGDLVDKYLEWKK